MFWLAFCGFSSAQPRPELFNVLLDDWTMTLAQVDRGVWDGKPEPIILRNNLDGKPMSIRAVIIDVAPRAGA